METNHDLRGGPGSFILRISDSPPLEEITSHQFPKKFVITIFDCHTGVTDLVQHLRTYLVKITVHSNDDLLMCRVFPSCLKGVALDWFYSLSSQSLRSFKVVSCAFFN